MNRRDFISSIGGVALSWPLAARAQQGERMRRIGFLMGFPENDPQSRVNVAAFHDGLKAVGLEHGRNIQIDYRWPGLDPGLARAFAKELIVLKPDIIVASTNQVVTIAMQETQTIPIVFVYIGDPIGSRYAETIARPGKNLTGFANFEAAIGSKWLELLKEVSPATKRIGFVYHPAVAPHLEFLTVATAAAPTFGLELTAIPVTNAAEIEQSVTAFATAGSNGGLVVAPHALTLGSHRIITAIATRYRLPGVYGDNIFSRSGGLLSFGIDPADQLRRAADYVDRILKGKSPADLPVQLPVKYAMVVNLTTAREFGLTIPPAVLTRADNVIE
jgi:ABC-type uncharacterized transport system substrate-binding protein